MMPILTVHRRQMLKLSIPYWVFINGEAVGIMQDREMNIQMPAGQYELSVRIVLGLFKWRFHIGGSRKIRLGDDCQHLHLLITDKERWWNLLFDIDLLFWVAKFFFELPYPWDMAYEMLSNGFFIIWMARVWVIRERYFQFVEQ